MARMLVTGGAGFIGSHLAEALLARDHDVIVIDDRSTGRRGNIDHLTTYQRLRFVEGTVTDQATVDTLVQQCDVVFHLAAVVGVKLTLQEPVRTFSTNFMGTECVLAAAHRYRKRVVVASSSEVYGKSTRVPFREDDEIVLASPAKFLRSYAASKVAAEVLAFSYHQQMDLPVTIVRLFNTVGPRQSGQHGMVLPRFVHQALRGEQLTVYGDGVQTRCFCDVDDVVRAIIEITDYPSAVGEAFNVGSMDEVTILELAHRVLLLTRNYWYSASAITARRQEATRIADPDVAIAFVPYPEAYGVRYEDSRRRVPDISKIRSLTGWAPRITLNETIERVIGSQAS